MSSENSREKAAEHVHHGPNTADMKYLIDGGLFGMYRSVPSAAKVEENHKTTDRSTHALILTPPGCSRNSRRPLIPYVELESPAEK